MKLHEKYLKEARRAPKFKSPEEIGTDTYLEWGTTEDGWNHKEIDMDTGLMEWIEEVERLAYELRNARRGSYAKFGDTIEDLQSYLQSLSRDLSRISKKLQVVSKRRR